jgi:phenylacetate-coenzyme A ligase PaaK-like adenylate-forming protein
MLDTAEFISSILKSKLNNFDELALRVFQFQYQFNPTYQKYCKLLHVHDMNRVDSIDKIPFLPIAFFKNHEIKSAAFDADIVFSSSSTTGRGQSFHHVKEVEVYRQSFIQAFEHFYGNISDYSIFALLPSYLERQGSSLVYMLEYLIGLSNDNESGFYLHNYRELYKKLISAKQANKKIILFGATFGLLDFADQYELNLEDAIIIETGGMKGRREELTRHEIHTYLKARLGVHQIHSEYGMTELLSQAYAPSDGIFYCPAWMKVCITDMNDPFEKLSVGKTGVINVIDLANIYSCSFIQTSDLGRLSEDGGFEILGRLDYSDLRGCSLLTV